ncbi:MAG TPA: DUF1835 domain-containing protein [Vicinamibacterales bacterium]|nr:DUF1835 domain-containing protein [Vicinamibacterales bacterium]
MSVLHITNGDSAAATLRAFVNPVVITIDPLFDGPARALEGEEWAEMRARHLGLDYTQSTLAEWDAGIRGADRHDEVVLWFEHDLYDQLLLIRTLDLLARQRADRLRRQAEQAPPLHTTVSLICIDRFPGVEPFYGLGQLNAVQLKSLFPARKAVTARQYDVASAAWRAFREPDPSALVELVRANGALDALPFLRAAIVRFFEEFPSTSNGLSRTQQLALDALAGTPMRLHELFRSAQRREARPFMGDLGFFDIVRDFASARVPLVTIDGDAVAITDAGREVRDGRRNAIAVNGIDQWRGGVHLTNAQPWRWDAGTQTLVSLNRR